MDFPREILLPQKTVFAQGSAADIGRECAEFGPRGLIVHGGSLERSGGKEEILRGFAGAAEAACFRRNGGEPTLDEITRVIEKAGEINAGWIAGIGGGSVLDLAKAAAGLFNAKERPVFYQEGGELEEKGIPFIAVPTTAGTGSEATPNSVIINSEKKVKLSIRDKSFLARKVILDAGLLKGISADVIACSGMDAFVQAYESFISGKASWFSGSLALKALELIDRNILPAHESGAEESLSSLLLAGYLCGIALASSRLGVIHGVAHPLGALYGLPHGLICSACLAPSIKLNREAMAGKYGIMSGVLGGDLSERADELLASLGISSPFKGRELIEKESIVAQALRSGSTAANPKRIERGDVEFILAEIF